MADSDEEYDRRTRGRDKFTKERSDFQDNRGGGSAGGLGRRDFGGDRRGYQHVSRDYKPFNRGRPDSPPMKRMRRDWDDAGGDFDPMTPNKRPNDQGAPSLSSASGVGSGSGGSVLHGSLAPLMSFKQFLAKQEDSISDEEAIKKYQDYKDDYKRQQLHAFFIAHKDQEWFRLKYHPEDSAKKRQEQQAAVKRRLDVFLELMEKGWIDKAAMEHTNGRHLIKLMDALVVKLEGGTDEDLLLLEKMEETEDEEPQGQHHRSPHHDDESEPKRRDERKESRGSSKKGDVVTETPRKSSREERSSKERSSAESADVDDGEKQKIEEGEEGERIEVNEAKVEKDEALSDGEMSDKGSLHSSKSSVHSPPASVHGEPGERSSVDEQPNVVPTNGDRGEQEVAADETAARRISTKSSSSPRQVECEEKRSKSPASSTKGQPQMWLHKTASIFLRNMAPTITKQEVETLCKRYPGFMRVSLAEPLPERRFYRRGWVTFKRDVNIREICWNLNSIRLKDCDLGAIVNRDLTRRIRTVNGITAHKQVAQNDLRLAARLVQICDNKWGLWQDDNTNESKSTNKDQPFTTLEYEVASKNPLLKNITDYLIEEGSAEEDELLGMNANATGSGDEQKIVVDRDDNLLKVLDRLLIYLRLVHSVDYYNHGEYPSEEEMPNRCGLMHVRGPPPSPSQWGQDEKSGSSLVAVQFIGDFVKGFEQKMQPLLTPKDRLGEADLEKLGKKDPDKEVEAFIAANCVELAKDKWLCPLSGKKFKGPEFIRKHIANKHGEKLDEVRVEVSYYNNYLSDPKRPADVDLPRPPAGGNVGGSGGGGGSNYDRGGSGYGDYRGGGGDRYRDFGGGRFSGGGGGSYHRGYGDYGGGGYGGGGGYRRDHYQRRDYGGGGNRNYGGGGGGGGGGARGGPPLPPPPHADGRRDPRVPVAYTDLDAPEDIY